MAWTSKSSRFVGEAGGFGREAWGCGTLFFLAMRHVVFFGDEEWMRNMRCIQILIPRALAALLLCYLGVLFLFAWVGNGFNDVQDWNQIG